MTRPERPILALGLLAVCAGTAVLMVAFVLGFPLLAPHAAADSAKAQRIAVPALVDLAAGVATLAGRRRGWAFGVGWVGVAAAVMAVLLTVLLPGA